MEKIIRNLKIFIEIICMIVCLITIGIFFYYLSIDFSNGSHDHFSILFVCLLLFWISYFVGTNINKLIK